MNRYNRYRARYLTFISTVVLVFLSSGPHTLHGFSQSGGTMNIVGSYIPMGHEWITRLAALELLGGDPVMKPDANDPRQRENWTKGTAKHLEFTEDEQREINRIKAHKFSDKRYESAYKFVYATIVGNRWVDIGGNNVTKSAKVHQYDCFDAIAQEPAELQSDHFMRRHDDRGAKGGVEAAKRSQNRFIEHFVTAAMAPSTVIKVWDGGGRAALTEVDLNYFLFGRAAHLFQDSFSSEHTVRIPEDNFERVRQVKSYLCAGGSEQHTHSLKKVKKYTSGDVIWKPGTGWKHGWPSYKPSNMKNIALVATEASKDLWAAFIRTMAVVPLAQREQVAREEAIDLVRSWLHINEAEALAWYDDESHRDDTYVLTENQTGKGLSVQQCMNGLDTASGSQAEKVNELKEERRICLFNIEPEQGYSDLYDPYLRIPFNWKWKSLIKWKSPPENWNISTVPADTGIRVRIKSLKNGHYMTAPDGIADDKWVYNRAGTPLDFILVGNKSDGFYFRLANNPSLFLSYWGTTGSVKLYHSPNQAKYKLSKARNGWSIFNQYWKNYMWLYKESPYITGTGDPSEEHSIWSIEGLPKDW